MTTLTCAFTWDTNTGLLRVKSWVFLTHLPPLTSLSVLSCFLNSLYVVTFSRLVNQVSCSDWTQRCLQSLLYSCGKCRHATFLWSAGSNIFYWSLGLIIFVHHEPALWCIIVINLIRQSTPFLGMSSSSSLVSRSHLIASSPPFQPLLCPSCPEVAFSERYINVAV